VQVRSTNGLHGIFKFLEFWVTPHNVVCTGITSNNELQFIPTTVVSDFPVKGVAHLSHRGGMPR
jgi:hypothetical protein